MSNRTYSISRSKIGDILLLDVATSPKGEWDASRISSGLYKIVEQSGYTKVLVDMIGIKPMTSDVIGQIIMLIKLCNSHDLQLKLCGVVAENKLALDLVNLDQLVEMYERKNQGVVAFKSNAPHLVSVGPSNGSAESFVEQAKSGDAESQFRLAKCLEEGSGGTQDFKQALTWFKKAAVQEHADSRHSLGVAYAYGIGAPQNFETAFDWFRLAAKQGHADSQFWVALTMHHGLISEADTKNAARWYKEAAEQGHSEARDALAELRRVIN